MNAKQCSLIAAVGVLTLLTNVSASFRKQQSEEASIVEKYYNDAFHFSSVEDFYRFYENFEIAKAQNTELKKGFDEKMQKCFNGVNFELLHKTILEGTNSVCSMGHVARLTQYIKKLLAFEPSVMKTIPKCRVSQFFKVYVLQILSQCLRHLKDHLHHGEVTVHKEDRTNLRQYLKELHNFGVQGKIERVPQISRVYGQMGMHTKLMDLIYTELTTVYRLPIIYVSQSYYDITEPPRNTCYASYPYYSAVLAVASLSQLIYSGGPMRFPYRGYEDVLKAAKGPTVERWVSIAVICQVFRQLRPTGSNELLPLDVPGQLTVELEPVDQRIPSFAYKHQVAYYVTRSFE